MVERAGQSLLLLYMKAARLPIWLQNSAMVIGGFSASSGVCCNTCAGSGSGRSTYEVIQSLIRYALQFLREDGSGSSEPVRRFVRPSIRFCMWTA